jgi:hypothetical protein
MTTSINHDENHLVSRFQLEIANSRVYFEAYKMTITLAKDVEEFLQGQLREGVCADASDLVNNVLRAVRDQKWGL